MERYFDDQVRRIDRLMALVRADNFPSAINGALTYYDIVILTCQAMWHLKDWVLNDPEFRPKDPTKLKAEIHAARVLLVCSDIANGSKHLSLNRPKVGASLSPRKGIHVEPAKGIFKEFYYVKFSDNSDPYYGVESREILEKARHTWQGIINDFHLSEVDIGA
jgi:hypothetical protein